MQYAHRGLMHVQENKSI